MDSGEGKSRVLMVYSLFLAMKNTLHPDQATAIDLATTDPDLASRDHIEYSKLIAALGIETTLITPHSPIKSYRHRAQYG